MHPAVFSMLESALEEILRKNQEVHCHVQLLLSVTFIPEQRLQHANCV